MYIPLANLYFELGVDFVPYIKSGQYSEIMLCLFS